MLDDKVTALVNSKIINRIPQEQAKGITFMAIITIASALISLFRQCPNLKQDLENDADKVLNWLKNPNLFNRARLYLTLRRQARKNGARLPFRVLVKAIQDGAQAATKEDVLTLCQAAELTRTDS